MDAARADAEAAEARVAQARSSALPSARVDAMIGAGRIDPGGFFGLTADDVTPRIAQVTVEYPLFTGGRTTAAVAQARSGADAARAGLDGTRRQLTVAVVAAYADVLTARQLVDSYTRMEGAVAEIVRGARLRFRVGDAASTELAQAEARLAEARAGLIAAQGRKASAEAQLNRLVGHEVSALAPLGELPAVPESLVEAMDSARAHNAMRAQAQSGIGAARAGVRGAEAASRPSIGTFVEAGHVRDQFFPNYRADSITIGARARWTFLDPGASARVREARASLAASEARARMADDAIEQAVIEAWHALASARGMVAASRDGVTAANEALRATSLEVRVGIKPQLAQLDAEREAIAAAARLAEAEGQLHVAARQLRALTGLE
ncbi:TolC family protein [Sphingomonas lacunae]|uniref:TolC family protein n=2 Tax=Sphingomonas lacunae TaxID=2698828 RepID=A0A6M4AWR4_9SPHN|nr:TolC family protein [Sphingomonas lacunae]